MAQTPIEPRDAARLLVVDRATGTLAHRVFRELPEYLRPGDVLVLNDTRVIPARLIGRRAGTGGQVELLLLHRRSNGEWETLARPGRRLREGARVVFGDGRLVAVVTGITPAGGRVVRFEGEDEVEQLISQVGQVPLPPYIRTPLADPERYQTVYAREPGAAAAPTAGLHFTPELLERIRDGGVTIAEITLHVGLGTFQPVKVSRVEEHEMHAEYYRVPVETVKAIRSAREQGGRVFAVGTTVVRTLETAAAGGELQPGDGWTRLFIYPGFRFRVVDALITNFHLPRSTLLLLVSAFAGRELIGRVYEEAVRQRYRFYSFGDAMLIV